MSSVDYHSLVKVLDKISETIYWMDENGRIIACNDKQAKVFGLKSPQELQGKNIFDVAELLGWPEHIPQTIRSNDLEVMETRQKQFKEETVILEGTERIFSAVKEPWLNEHNQVVGIVGIGIDITKQKQSEQLKKQKEEAEKRELRSKAQAETENRQSIMALTGSIVHDLRTPILTIDSVGKGYQDYFPVYLAAYHWALEQGWDEYKPVRKARERQLERGGATLRQEAERLNQYINTSLKTLQKAMAQELNWEDLVPCSMEKAVRRLWESYPFRPGEEHHVQDSEVENFTFYGNDIMMQRVLVNLLDNAMQQIRQHRKGAITLWTEHDEQANYLYFQDTAGGASPEQVAQMFQADYTTKAEGTGIGLAFCKKVMQDFGGDITAESELGHFMRFQLRFPKQLPHLSS